MPTATALRLMSERNQWTCEVEGCDNPAEEAHHIFYGRKRGKRPVHEFDMDQNLMLVCRECHHITGKAKSYETACAFWKVQCERYDMHAWNESLPIIYKNSFE
jgi:hypothetical protein